MGERSAVGSGDWNDFRTWDPRSVPQGNSDVRVAGNGLTVTLAGKGFEQTLDVGGGNTVALTGGSLEGGPVFLNRGTLEARSGINQAPVIRNFGGTVAVVSGASLAITTYESDSTNGASTLNIDDNATLTITGGQIIDRANGQISLNSTGKLTQLILAAPTRLASVGVFKLSDSAYNVITSSASGGLLTNAYTVISGAGQLGGGKMSITNEATGTISGGGTQNALVIDTGAKGILKNQGTIEAGGKGLVITNADFATGASKVQNTGTIHAGIGSSLRMEHVDVGNKGTIEAADGATLGFTDVVINNADGKILTGIGSKVTANDTRISGGTFTAASDTTLYATGASTITGTAISIGSLDLAAGASLRIKGGSFNVAHDVSDAGALAIDGSWTLQGGGKFLVTGSLSVSDTLTNVDNLITGSGTVRVGTLSNQSDGRLDGSLTVKATTLSNAGSITRADIESTTMVNTGVITGGLIETSSLVNKGTIEGEPINGEGLIKAKHIDNDGTISSVTFDVPYDGQGQGIIENDGTINASTFGRTVISSNGLIQAVGGKFVQFGGTQLFGGTLSSSDGGVIRTVASTDVTLLDPEQIASGTAFVIENGSNVRFWEAPSAPELLDGITMSIRGSSKTTTVALNGGPTILRGGTMITLSDDISNKLVVTSNLVNEKGTISGAGTIIGNPGARLDNQAGGLIEAKGKNALTLSMDHINNDGVLEADGSTFKVVTSDDILGGGKGVVTNGGTLDLSDAHAFLGNFQYAGRGTILGPDRTPGGTISGFASGDNYIFGEPTTLAGTFGTIWQANATNTGGTLTITSGLNQTYATLQLAGVYTSDDFSANAVTMADGKHVSVSFVGALDWAKPVSGNWNTAANWNPSGLYVPGADDNAVIAATGGSYKVTVSQDTTVKTVATGGSAILDVVGARLTILEGTQKTANSGMVRLLSGGGLTIGGIFAQTSTGSLRAQLVGQSIDLAKGATVSGGEIDLFDGRTLNAASGSATLANVTLNNRGIVSVEKTYLKLTGTTVIGGGGTIEVDGPSTLGVENTSITGGKIKMAGALEIYGDIALDTSIVLDGGRIKASDSSANFVNHGTITGNGTIGVGLINEGNIRSESGSGIAILSSTAAIINQDRMTARGSGRLRIVSALDNRGNFVAKDGGLGLFDSMVTNSGRMQADGSDATFEFKGDLANSGVVGASDGADIDLKGAITQTAGGELRFSRNSTLALRPGASITGGLLSLSQSSTAEMSGGGQVRIAQATVLMTDRSGLLLSNTTLTLDGSVLRAYGGSTINVENSKTNLVLANSTIQGADIRVSGGKIQVAGEAGLLTATQVSLGQGARIGSNGSAATLTNFGLITGSGGFVGDATLSLINDGTITSGFSGGPVVIDTGKNAVVNQGVITASVFGSETTIASALSNMAKGRLLSGGGTVVAKAAVDNAGVIEAQGGGQIRIEGALTNTRRISATGDGDVTVRVIDNSGQASAMGEGSNLVLGSDAVVTNSGWIMAGDNGTVTFKSGVNNAAGGQLNAKSGGTIIVEGAAAGGIAWIGDEAVMDFEGSRTVDTTTAAIFANEGIGHLLLNNSSRFAGTVSDFGVGDMIDVKDVAFDTGNDFYDPSTKVLTVTDGMHTAKIQLLGQYAAGNFAFSSDGHGGTLVTGAVVPAPLASFTDMLAAHA